MFVKVIFHGILKKICPDEYEVDATTPSEAIRAITNQFRDKLIRKDGQRFVCSVKECPRDIELNGCIKTEELNVYPSFCSSGGGKKGGLIQTIVGALLVIIGILLVVYTGGALSYFGAALISAGLGLMSGGISAMMMKDTTNDSSNPDSSKTFGNSNNTTKIGTRIPIGYGTYKIGGHYLSINTSASTIGGDIVKTINIFGSNVKRVVKKFGVDSNG